MHFNAPIKMIVLDDPSNPPDADIVATTFILKVARNCELPVIKQKLIEHYPILENMMSVLYFIDTNDCRTTLFNHRSKSFWNYYNGLREDTACIYVNAMIFKHPNKICLNCSGEIYGIIYQCERCDQHTACIRCVNNGTALCFTHGKDFLKSEIIPMPSNVVHELNLAQVEESRQRDLARRRQRQRFAETSQIMGSVSH